MPASSSPAAPPPAADAPPASATASATAAASPGLHVRQRDADHARLISSDKAETANAVSPEAHDGQALGRADRDAIVLLVVLYFVQGIPVGLAFGTMPFLLKAKLSYTDIGLFSLCTWPYSLKLLWSPLVDSVYARAWGPLPLGRRKTWIVPTQLLFGVLLLGLGTRIEALLASPVPPVGAVTALFFVLVTVAATQDIAVDGWALTLLSPDALSYASTAQTVGLNTGYFLSFTVFLALNSVEFCNRWLRTVPADTPVLSLATYLHATGALCLAVTVWLLLCKREAPEDPAAGELGVADVYAQMAAIVRLEHVQQFIVVHLVSKIGFQANEAVTGLKLVEKGFGKEDLALAVLLDFPLQIVLGYFAAKHSRGASALSPWLAGFAARLACAAAAAVVVARLPTPVGPAYWLLILATTIAGSFANTIQFVGISAFHTQIADPAIGGTYMTLLNTVSNLGGTWPRPFVLKAVDALTTSHCTVPPSGAAAAASAAVDTLLGTDTSSGAAGAECTSDAGRAACLAAGGQCRIDRDGYYVTTALCIAIGTATLLFYVAPVARRLQALPAAAWRVAAASGPKKSQ